MKSAPTVVCDECGAAMDAGPQVVAVTPDSSAVDPSHPERDGWRLLVACSEPCLQAREAESLRRPFVPEELWAGKLQRVMQTHPHGALPAQLLQESGLTPVQMRAGCAWLDEQQRRSRQVR